MNRSESLPTYSKRLWNDSVNLQGILRLTCRWQIERMKCHRSPYNEHRFPAEIISHAAWHYDRFYLSFREVEELLARHGIDVMSNAGSRHSWQPLSACGTLAPECLQAR